MSNSNQVNINFEGGAEKFGSNIVKEVVIPLASFTPAGIVAHIASLGEFIVGEFDIVLFTCATRKSFYIFKKGMGIYTVQNPIAETDLKLIEISKNDFTDDLKTKLEGLFNELGAINATKIAEWDAKLAEIPLPLSRILKANVDILLGITTDKIAEWDGKLSSIPHPLNTIDATKIAQWDASTEETTTTIKQKRPLKTVGGNSLDGTGDIPFPTPVDISGKADKTYVDTGFSNVNTELAKKIQKNPNGSDFKVWDEKGSLLPLRETIVYNDCIYHQNSLNVLCSFLGITFYEYQQKVSIKTGSNPNLAITTQVINDTSLVLFPRVDIDYPPSHYGFFYEKIYDSSVSGNSNMVKKMEITTIRDVLTTKSLVVRTFFDNYHHNNMWQLRKHIIITKIV